MGFSGSMVRRIILRETQGRKKRKERERKGKKEKRKGKKRTYCRRKAKSQEKN